MTSGHRSLALPAVLALLLAALAVASLGVAEPWTSPRGDAAGTGFQSAEGPAWKDVAFEIRTPENLFLPDTQPLILEDRVLFLAGESGLDRYHVLSADLETAEVEKAATLEGVPFVSKMATDGSTVFLTANNSVHARPLEADGAEWTWRWDTRLDDDAGSCYWMTVDRGHLTVLCWQYSGGQTASVGDVRLGPGTDQAVTVAARLDAETGEPQWVWKRPELEPEDAGPSSAVYVLPMGISVSGPHVVVQTYEYPEVADDSVQLEPTRASLDEFAVRALDRRTGVAAWNNTWAAYPGAWGEPVASGDGVYVKASKVRKLNPGTGDELWQRGIGEEDYDPDLGGSTALALAGRALYTTSAQTVYRIDTADPQDGWSKRLNLSAEQGFDENPVVTPSTVYVAAETPDNPGPLYAFDAADGDVLWKKQTQDLFAFSVGEGVIAYIDYGIGGNASKLVVLGETEASPDPSVDVSSAYPAPGEPVRVNLSGSEPGLEGPVTRYKAVWGDGTTTGWQEDPVLTHTYHEGGDHQARFVVGNDANQTASTAETFHVGQPEPNVVSEAFAPDNQEMTFGIIGIVMALGGGAVGVTRRYRKRSRLERELDALEQGFEDTRRDPGECEAFLDTRKGRARSLALDGKLNEEQAGIVASRAEELRRELRRGAVEEEFGFLPHELVRKARTMLEDGEVTELEAEAFLAALEEVDFLREEQEALVRERIEDWYGRDAGGGVG